MPTLLDKDRWIFAWELWVCRQKNGLPRSQDALTQDSPAEREAVVSRRVFAGESHSAPWVRWVLSLRYPL